MLTKMISKELIQLQVEVTDWEMAIRKSAQPLVDHGKITSGYVDGILQSFEENGPYFVLLPSVALPHARSEMGALQDAIGITVLKNAVESGSSENDPVKYFFTLSATSNTNHLNALAVLADLLEDKEFFDLLDTATNADQIMDYISK